MSQFEFCKVGFYYIAHWIYGDVIHIIKQLMTRMQIKGSPTVHRNSTELQIH